MRPGGLFRFLVALLAVGAVAALVSGAYSAGYVAGAGTNAAGTSPWVYGGFYGVSGIVGIIVTILIIAIVFRILGMLFWHNHWRSWAEGPNGPQGRTPGDWTYGWHGGWRARRWEARQAFLEDWHRRTHEAQSQSGATGGPAPSAHNSGTQI